MIILHQVALHRRYSVLSHRFNVSVLRAGCLLVHPLSQTGATEAVAIIQKEKHPWYNTKVIQKVIRGLIQNVIRELIRKVIRGLIHKVIRKVIRELTRK